MVKRHEAYLRRVKIDGGKDAGLQKGSSDLSDDSGGISDKGAGESDDPDVVAARMLEAEADEKSKPVEMIWDPNPLAGGTDGLHAQEEDSDWAKAGPAERLSAAGAAAAAPDASAIHAGSDVDGRFVTGVHFNPKGRPVSVVHWSEHERLRALAKDWYGQAVGDGADAVRRDELDPWQKFAHDIVTGLPGGAIRTEAIRLFLLGSAGTGKSRTVRSFVCTLRDRVRAEFEKKIQDLACTRGNDVSVRAKIEKLRVQKEEALRHVCLLAAPTGCASFQLKFGASTLHRIFGVPVGYCGPWRNKNDARFRKTKDRMDRSRLFVMDEMSMIGRMMLGKIEFKVRDTLGQKVGAGGEDLLLGGKDTVLSGDPKQAPPLGDEPMWREGEYRGKGKNKPKGSDGTPPGAKSAKELVRLGLMARNTFQDVALLRQVHRVRDPGADVPEERRESYRNDAAEFLHVTKAMADCTWTPEERAWLARRNRSVLQMTPEGRSELQKFESAPLLMDGRKTRITGETGADHMNLLKLKQLAARTRVPIYTLCARHGVPKDKDCLDVKKMKADDFRGMEAELLTCTGARMLLTQNLWVEAGLMNGALGDHKGYMWPEDADAQSDKIEQRTPLCVFVEFDSVNLIAPDGQRRSFFPNDPEKQNWVPIFRQPVSSTMEANVVREQYPLTLAWALTHWKAQGMTLDRVRVHLSDRTAGIPGIAFVAVTRVRHPWDIVFEEDLPALEHFMKARNTVHFRERQRFELRQLARASRTLRKYGFCEADSWTSSEREDAALLLKGLDNIRAQQCETLRNMWASRGP